jgi:hypothetical protein
MGIAETVGSTGPSGWGNGGSASVSAMGRRHPRMVWSPPAAFT